MCLVCVLFGLDFSIFACVSLYASVAKIQCIQMQNFFNINCFKVYHWAITSTLLNSSFYCWIFFDVCTYLFVCVFVFRFVVARLHWHLAQESEISFYILNSSACAHTQTHICFTFMLSLLTIYIMCLRNMKNAPKFRIHVR